MYVNPTMQGAAQRIPDLASVLAVLDPRTVQTRDIMHAHEKRQFGYGYGYGYDDNTDSAWYRYGRWILLGVLVGLAILVWLFVCGCNRKRTRTGQQPVKYTGWATPGYSQPQQFGTTEVQPYPSGNTQQQYPMQEYPANGYANNNTGAGYANNNTGAAVFSSNETAQPPSYPVQTPAYPAAVGHREK